MGEYVGLHVSKEETAFCVKDEAAMRRVSQPVDALDPCPVAEAPRWATMNHNFPFIQSP